MTITLGEAEGLVAKFIQEVQTAVLEMQALGAGAEGLADSQQAFHHSLGPAGADLDRETVTSVGAMHTATTGVQEQAGNVNTIGNQVLAHLTAAGNALQQHRRLDEEHKAHGDPGKSSFYNPK